MADHWVYDVLRAGVCAGVSSSAAAVFTNPLEVVKTRLQMQGEMERGAASHTYRGFLHGFTTIGRQEGMAGLQRGLTAALLFNVTTNSVRFGLYGELKSTFTGGNDPGWDGGTGLDWDVVAARAAAAMVACGLGGFFGSPFYLVKARLQVQSPHFTTKTKHPPYRGAYHALHHVVRAQGWAGLATGVKAQVVRMALGGGTQLTTYDVAKTLAVNAQWAAPDSTPLHLACSMAAASAAVIVATPADVVVSRMYVSDKYTGMLDCLATIIRTEGVPALYRGLVPRFLRIAPHTALTFLFFEQARSALTTLGW